MILHTLNLANYRAFEQIEIEFENDVTIIAGVNGVGKSAILDAIAVMFSRALPEFTEAKSNIARSFDDDDVLVDKPSLEISGIMSVAEHRCHGVLQRVAKNKTGDLWYLLLERLQTGSLHQGELENVARETRTSLQCIKESPNHPVVVLFSSGRLLQGRVMKMHTPNLADKTRAYTAALTARSVELRETMEWFYAQQELEKSPRSDVTGAQRVIVAALQQVVSEFMQGFSNLRVVYDPKPRFRVDKNGATIQINQLSDGERGLLAIVFDITRRLAIANPTAANPIADGKGIVLIDEIELHMHPEWQRKAMRWLRGTFQNCQFIATTHSPQVLGETEARCVRYLFRDEQKRVRRYTPDQALGLDSNRVLEEIMGTPARNVEVQSFLHELFRAIDREDFPQAQERMRQISERLGDSDPELVRARSLISFLGGQNEEHRQG
ncbi:MAG: hypothetical protein A2498_08350 [Lentisphaerae bacterium RIFOXYC12_FULL_60_16]|nr:MAG: hypothetical protein A2498_08350 [Lentisphaerae bacterium RIFOXYC12_FULL_60_16]